MARAISLPSNISTDVAVVGTNVGLALLTMIVMLATAAVFNQTLEENDEDIRAVLRWLAKPFAAGAGAAAFFSGDSWSVAIRG